MLFCPKCGSLMTPKVEKGKKVLSCACGYTNKKISPEEARVKEVVKAAHSGSYDIVSEDDTTLPVTEALCPDCGHDKAYWWSKQTRASDEPETKFLKCEKCKNIWRDAG